MTNFPSNPEGFRPDISIADTQELHFIPIEYYSRDQLARDILSGSTDTWKNDTTGTEHRRAHWEDVAQTRFDLFELQSERGQYFVLDTQGLGQMEQTRYTFAEWGEPTYKITDTDRPYEVPSRDIVNEQIRKHLLAQHQHTEKGKRAQQQYDAAFHAISGQFSAEVALNYDTNGQLASEAQASDKIIRTRARDNLYKLARNAEVYSDELSFGLSLEEILVIRRQKAIQAAEMQEAANAISETRPLPRAYVTPPWPDFEITPKPPKHWNFLRFLRRR